MVTFKNKASKDLIGPWAKSKAQRKLGSIQGRGSERKEVLPEEQPHPQTATLQHIHTDRHKHTQGPPAVKLLNPTPPHDLPQWFVWPGPRIPQGLAPDHIPL